MTDLTRMFEFPVVGFSQIDKIRWEKGELTVRYAMGLRLREENRQYLNLDTNGRSRCVFPSHRTIVKRPKTHTKFSLFGSW